jgi:hypothetical protein
MRQDLTRYIYNCHTCQWSGTSRQPPVGVQRSLSVPSKQYNYISMPFITGLLWPEGYDSVWLVVDWLTKRHHLVLCQTTILSLIKHICSCNIFSIFTGFMTPASQIAKHNSPLASSNSFIPDLESRCNSPPYSTLKPMTKRNMSMQCSNNFSKPMSLTFRMLGLPGFPWLSSPQITTNQKPLVWPHSWPTIVATLI